MTEKAYKVMGYAGAASLAVGIVSIVIGVTVGAVMIISGAHLVKAKKGLTF